MYYVVPFITKTGVEYHHFLTVKIVLKISTNLVDLNSKKKTSALIIFWKFAQNASLYSSMFTLPQEF